MPLPQSGHVHGGCFADKRAFRRMRPQWLFVSMTNLDAYLFFSPVEHKSVGLPPRTRRLALSMPDTLALYCLSLHQYVLAY